MAFEVASVTESTISLLVPCGFISGLSDIYILGGAGQSGVFGSLSGKISSNNCVLTN